MATRKPGVHVHLEPELLERVRRFRHERYFESQSEAFRYLIAYALDALAKEPPQP